MDACYPPTVRGVCITSSYIQPTQDVLPMRSYHPTGWWYYWVLHILRVGGITGSILQCMQRPHTLVVGRMQVHVAARMLPTLRIIQRAPCAVHTRLLVGSTCLVQHIACRRDGPSPSACSTQVALRGVARAVCSGW
jgi:hypothetical protein